MSDYGGGWGASPADTPGTWEYNSREAYLQETQARLDRINQSMVGDADRGGYPPGGAPPGGHPSGGRRAPALSKWVALTLPLAVLFEMIPVHGPHGAINGFAKLAAAFAIAGLGSPRARPVAIFVLVLLAGAAFWVWS